MRHKGGISDVWDSQVNPEIHFYYDFWDFAPKIAEVQNLKILGIHSIHSSKIFNIPNSKKISGTYPSYDFHDFWQQNNNLKISRNSS